jgi:hypothetical protein
MTDPDRPPLWKLMADAYHSTVHDFDNVPHAYAAELRAIARRIGHEFPFDPSTESSAMNIVCWLRHHADRAEAGE